MRQSIDRLDTSRHRLQIQFEIGDLLLSSLICTYGSCQKYAVIADTKYFVIAESYTHHTTSMLFEGHLGHSVLGDDSKDEDRTVIGSQGNLKAVIVKCIAIDIAPLRRRELQLPFGCIPQTKSVAVRIEDVACIIRQHEVRNTSGDPKDLRYGVSCSSIKQEDSIVRKRGKKKSLTCGQLGHSRVRASPDNN